MSDNKWIRFLEFGRPESNSPMTRSGYLPTRLMAWLMLVAAVHDGV